MTNYLDKQFYTKLYSTINKLKDLMQNLFINSCTNNQYEVLRKNKEAIKTGYHAALIASVDASFKLDKNDCVKYLKICINATEEILKVYNGMVTYEIVEIKNINMQLNSILVMVELIE